MPPRHAYWTILVDDQPTAFRAHDPEELLPTLNRLREKNATAIMKWFERGQLFDSRDAARDAGLGQGERRWEGPRPDRDDRPPRRDGAGPADRPAPERRGKEWRPGGEHKDPRQKYKDAKKAKWNRFKGKIRERHDERAAKGSESFTPPHGDKLRERRPTPDERRPPVDDGPSRPHGDKLRPKGPSAGWDESGDWRDRPRDDRRDQHRADRGEYRGRDDSRDRGGYDHRGGSGDRGEFGGRKPPDARPEGRRFKPAGAPHDRERNQWSDRPPRRDDNRGDRGGYGQRSGYGGKTSYGPRPERRDFGPGESRPGGFRPDRSGARKPWVAKPGGAGGGGARKPWGAKPGAGGGGRKPWGSKPPSGGSRGGPARKPWSPRDGGSPGGNRPRKRRDDDE